MTQTTTSTAEPGAVLQDLYDLLMFNIEPELMSAIVPQLETLYANETKAEQKKRLKRYQKALKLFDERFGKLFEEWKTQLLARKDEIIKTYTTEEGKKEKKTLQNLEDSISKQ